MTAKQRAAVVELLRCAADVHDPLDTFAFCITRSQLGHPLNGRIHVAACMALTDVGRKGTDWRHACLEAAARLEEGTWP